MPKITIDIDLQKFDELAAAAKETAAKSAPVSGKAETIAAMEFLHSRIIALRSLKQPVPWSCKVDGAETLHGIAGMIGAVWKPSCGKPLSGSAIKAHTRRIEKERAEQKAAAAVAAEKRRTAKSGQTRPTPEPTAKPTPKPTLVVKEVVVEAPTEPKPIPMPMAPPATPRLFGSLMRASSPKPQPPAAPIDAE